MNWLGNVQWNRFGESLQELWAAPGSNLGASLLFVAAVGIILLILVLLGIVAVYALMLQEDEEDEEYDDEEGGDELPAIVSDTSEEAPSEESSVQIVPRWARALVWFVLIVVALVMFDVTGGNKTVCLSCHQGKPHMRETSDPHKSISCVRCHEDRHGVAWFSAAAARGAHILSAAVSPSWSNGYGAITVNACRKCHAKVATGTIIIRKQELRVSHMEPLKAGARCLDCHELNDQGEIAERNRGMTTCLRCHDGKHAKNACAQCHLGDPSAAIRDDEKDMVFSAEILVPDYRCGGCHGDQAKCDKCHGLRMPHNEAFKKVKHAKFGAFDRKATCFKVCHTVSQCNKCHGFNPGARVSGHAPDWIRMHGYGRSMDSACACHSPENDPKRPFCPICHD